MISLLCQKTNSGKITSANRDIVQHLVLDNDDVQLEQNTETHHAKYNRFESSFLKKFPKTKNDKVNFDQTIIDDESPYDEKEEDHVLNFRTSYGSNRRPAPVLRACSVKSSNRSMRSANSENNLAILTSAKSIGSSNANETQQQPSENFVQEFYKQRAKTAGLRQNPLRKLDSAKLKKVEDWVNQTVNKDKKLIDSDYYKKINEFIQKETEISKAICKEIDEAEVKELRKKELRYKLWYLNVYEPIQAEIYKSVHGPSADYARYTRDMKYLEYLRVTNKRGGVFQDDFEPDEYNPIDQVDTTIQTGKLKDPTRLGKEKYYEEEALIYKCLYGKHFTPKDIDQAKLPFIYNDNETRKDIDWKKWLLLPHSNIESSARLKSALRRKPENFATEINIDNAERDNHETYCSSHTVYGNHFEKMRAAQKANVT